MKHGSTITCRRANSRVWWKYPTSLAKEKLKTQLSAGKVMLTVFWDSQGPILEPYQERGTTVNSAHYSEILRDKLKPAIQGLLSKGVALLHDNAICTQRLTLLKPSAIGTLRY
jgi:hypothetical protein